MKQVLQNMRDGKTAVTKVPVPTLHTGQAHGRLCLWGGVNGHLTIERGSPEDVESEVARAMQILAPQGGFILSPVDNVREDSAGIEANVKRLIQSWEQRR
jgi:hypothetical protein